MIQAFLKEFEVENGVSMMTTYMESFESAYLNIRNKEGRLLSDDLVRSLPNIPKNHALYIEWMKRNFTFKNLTNHLISMPLKNILDIGCGNGWLVHNLSNALTDSSPFFLGLDVNKMELVQAARLFDTEKTKFAFGDIFAVNFPTQSVDCIILNASAQYFEDLGKFIRHLLPLLSSIGQIHILDTPIYSKEKALAAKAATARYYSSINSGEMTAYYNHHTWDSLQGLPYEILRRPRPTLNRFLSQIGLYRSPFPWIVIHNR